MKIKAESILLRTFFRISCYFLKQVDWCPRYFYFLK